MVRALATGEVKVDQWIRTVLKELGVGVALGLTMGLAGSLLGYVRGGPAIGVVVGLSMLAIIVVANIIGVAIPFLLTKFRLDPAVASSPLITSVADAAGLLIYFVIASNVLHL
jgi:magnesium transporter